MTVDSLKEAMEADADLFVLDVRRPDEFADGHVPGAVNVCLDDLSQVSTRQRCGEARDWATARPVTAARPLTGLGMCARLDR